MLGLRQILIHRLLAYLMIQKILWMIKSEKRRRRTELFLLFGQSLICSSFWMQCASKTRLVPIGAKPLILVLIAKVLLVIMNALIVVYASLWLVLP